MEIIKLKNYVGILKKNTELHIGYRKVFKIDFEECKNIPIIILIKLKM